jgi:hypothetical protein
MKIYKKYSDNLASCDQFLNIKTILVIFSFILIFSGYELLTSTITFILLDFVLAIYLTSLFHSKYKYLFLIHPIFLLLSSYGFEIPFADIGVGFTYITTFDILVNPLFYGHDSVSTYCDSRDNIFGFCKVYFGIFPIIWLPTFLYGHTLEMTLYYSMGLFNMLFVAIAVYISQFFHILNKKTLLIISLYATVSPTFFEINSTLHRYELLFLGLFLFLLAYIGLIKQKKSTFNKIGLAFVLFISILCIGYSKPQLFLVLLLFVFIEQVSSNRIPIFSRIYNNFEKKLLLGLFILVVQSLAFLVIPGEYAPASNFGGHLTNIVDIPLLGFIVRVVYAILSPFPWINFTQWELYGYNSVFLIIHMLSSFLASWLIISTFFRIGLILKSLDNDKTIIIFGISIIASLMFSAVGFNVYLAPALPFLAVILLKKSYRVPIVYPMGFILLMEIAAHVARLIRI